MKGNMGNMMKQMQKMQKQMLKAQEELLAKEFTASVGGGMVTVTADGSRNVTGISINEEAVDPDDVEMLEDLILTCVNEALRKVDSAQADQLGKFNIPGFM